MAFKVSTVEDRISEFPNRRTLTKENGTSEVVTVTRNEGEVSKEGTAWGATYANDLESRINTETNLLETNFGHVETTTTASKPYSVGETLVLNGTMYKVTAAITQGATLTVGTNIAVHSVSEINSNLGGTTFSVTADGAYVHYTPTGGADPVVKKLGSQDFNFKLYVSGIFSGQDPSITKAASITLDVTDYKTVRADYTFIVDGTSHPANTDIDISGLTGDHVIGFTYTSVTPYDKVVSFGLYI